MRCGRRHDDVRGRLGDHTVKLRKEGMYPMLRTHRTKILALLLLAGGLTAGALVWQTNTRTTTGTTGGGDVYTHAEDAATCAAQARAFSDYPLVWAGPSVLGYPLVHCDHAMTKTRRDEQGRISHPGGDSWGFAYGHCETPEGRESCAPPRLNHYRPVRTPRRWPDHPVARPAHAQRGRARGGGAHRRSRHYL